MHRSLLCYMMGFYIVMITIILILFSNHNPTGHVAVILCLSFLLPLFALRKAMTNHEELVFTITPRLLKEYDPYHADRC